jgi:uncharacterized protein with NRDE domain
MGLNAAGLFVGLTNMRSHDVDRRSRGEIVMAALSCRTPTEVVSLLRREASNGEFRPFNLLFGHASDLQVAYHRDDGLIIERLAAGRHVLPSGGVLDDRSLPKVARGHELLERAAAERDLDGLVDALYAALADDVVPDVASLPDRLRGSDLGDELVARIQALNVKTEVYGTRSSTIVALGRGRRLYYYADGPPPASLRRVDHLLNGVVPE